MLIYVHPLLKVNDYLDKLNLDLGNKPVKAGSIERIMNSTIPFLLASKLPGQEIPDLWKNAVNLTKDLGEDGLYFTTRLDNSDLTIYDLFVMYSPDDTKAKEILIKEISGDTTVATGEVRIASIINQLKERGITKRVRYVSFDDTLKDVFKCRDSDMPIKTLELSDKYILAPVVECIPEKVVVDRTQVILGERPDLIALVDKPTSGSELLIGE